MPILFLDEDGNGMAAGVEVTIYPANAAQTLANVAGTDWTQAGGLCPNLFVTPSSNYVAVFVGRQGPVGAQAFTASAGSTTTVTCQPYRSPSLTETNYASLQTNTLWPKGQAWWSDAARAPGGVAWAIAYAYGAIFASVDTDVQNRLQAARVQSSAGGDVDTWAYDFLGQWVTRYDGETDRSFKQRIYAALQNPKTTLQCIYNIVLAFYQATVLNSIVGQLGFDVNLGAFDSTQGVFDILTAGGSTIPTISVWDRQSQPALANKYHVNPDNDDGSFVIQLGFNLPNPQAWYLGGTDGRTIYSSLDYDSFLINISDYGISDQPPDPRLGELVNFVKAGGSKPLYLTTFNNP